MKLANSSIGQLAKKLGFDFSESGSEDSIVSPMHLRGAQQVSETQTLV
ncbi:hypothetical protein AB9F47_22300 [Rhizobium leguminosarum]